MYPGYNAQHALQEARVRELEQDAATKPHMPQPSRFALVKGWLRRTTQGEQAPPHTGNLRQLTGAKITPRR